jgi:hypothetical protein
MDAERIVNPDHKPRPASVQTIYPGQQVRIGQHWHTALRIVRDYVVVASGSSEYPYPVRRVKDVH